MILSVAHKQASSCMMFNSPNVSECNNVAYFSAPGVSITGLIQDKL